MGGGGVFNMGFNLSPVLPYKQYIFFEDLRILKQVKHLLENILYSGILLMS